MTLSAHSYSAKSVDAHKLFICWPLPWDKVSEGRNNSHSCNIWLVIVPGVQEKLNKQRMKGSRKTDRGWMERKGILLSTWSLGLKCMNKSSDESRLLGDSCYGITQPCASRFRSWYIYIFVLKRGFIHHNLRQATFPMYLQTNITKIICLLSPLLLCTTFHINMFLAFKN